MSEATAHVSPTLAVRRFFSPDNRFLAPVLITGILVTGQYTFGILESAPQTLVAILVSVVAEMLLGRFVRGEWPNLASGYISGISVGILIRSPMFWPYAACSLLSILSKYAVVWRGRHIWNPSNLGVSAMLLLAPDVVAGLSIQWGNDIWVPMVIWTFGFLAVYRLRRFHICVTYVVSFLVFSFVRSLITGDAYLATLAPITGPMYQLFVFFMITDPRTTVRGRLGQSIVVVLVALVEMVLRLNEFVYAPFYALFLVGPPAFIWDLRRSKNSEAAAAHVGREART